MEWNGMENSQCVSLFLLLRCSPECLALTPTDIYKWMYMNIYGTEDPHIAMTPQKKESTLEYWKKAISYFMQTTAKWHDGTQTGNPTQSKEVNDLIKAVKRSEEK